MSKLILSIVFLTTLSYLIACASSEKILFLLPIATKSHKNVFDPLIKALANRNHTITVVSPVEPSKAYKNVHEIVPVPYDQIWNEFTDPLEQRRKGTVGAMTSSNHWEFVFKACDKAYEHKEFLGLLNQEFDLVFLNGFINNCFDGFVHKLGAPFIMVTSQAAPNYVTELAGNHLPWSFVPMTILDATHEMTFQQRLLNVVAHVGFGTLGKIFFTSRFEASYRNALGSDLPDMKAIEGNVSMIFSNSYFPLTFPRPALPDVIEVGGMHCGPAKPLPKDLDDFLSGAEHGFIYFSMGSVLNTKHLPDDMRLKFMNVFSRMKQRVIWKWNSGEMDELPPNVRVSKWLPQQDILGHPNIRVFMTHGGLLSTQEAAYHGVPSIGIPVFADQDLNMKQAEHNGYALTLEILDFTEESLENLLNKILNEPQYKAKAKQLSSVIQDQLQTPVERAVFWSEYVMRHKGAPHLRSAARKLNFLQYHSLDVIAFLGLILFSIAFIVYRICKVCVRRMCGQKEKVSKAEIKKKRA